MTSFPPLFLVISGRLPLGLICSEVPSVTERSAFLRGGDRTSRAEKRPWLFAGVGSRRGVKSPSTVPAGFVRQREVAVGQGVFPVQNGVS